MVLPSHKEALLGLAELWLKVPDVSLAKKIAKVASERFPDVPKARQVLAAALRWALKFTMTRITTGSRFFLLSYATDLT